MKIRTLLAGALLVSASWLKAAELSAPELKRATDYLVKTRDALVAATTGLSDAQWTFKAGPTRWSVAEVTEHLAATEEMLMGMIQAKIMQAPARAETVDLKELDEFVIKTISDRSNKAQAPETLVPTNRFGSPAASLKQFRENRAKTLAYVKATKGLRDHAADSPIGKKLDGYQWLLFIAAHCERHTKQLLEVKADPGFPRR